MAQPFVTGRENTNGPLLNEFVSVELSPNQVAGYLEKNNRSAESLLAAFENQGDKALLREAAEKFPNDPRVQMAVLTQDTIDKGLTPEERTLWLQKSSPDNGLPNLIAALESFKNGNFDAGLAQIESANNKPGLNGFSLERIQAIEEMYLAAGSSPLEAKEQGTRNLLLPLERQMKDLVRQLAEMQKTYLAAGDTASAAQLAELGATLGRRWADPNSSPFMISEQVGVAMQRIALEQLDPQTYYEFLGKTVEERLAELKAERAEATERAAYWAQYYHLLNDNDKIIFLDRFKTFGERSAMGWLQQRSPKVEGNSSQ